MSQVPDDIRQRLRTHGQEHVLTGWERLSAGERQSLLEQIAAIDLAELAALVESGASAAPASREIEPLPVAPAAPDSAARAIGEEALRQGRVAALVVAGGQGSRLGFEKPKGMFPIGPVSGATLFQLHAEKLLALARRYRKAVPFLVMTSPATDAETRDYFHAEHYFGLDRNQVIFFQQQTMPAVCARSGRLLLEAPGRLFLSPNGHGGTITALAEHGLFEELAGRGVEQIYYFQVDNPLLKICDPEFIGRHLAERSEATSKVVFKDRPDEKVGVFARIEGRCGLVEYSDMPAELTEAREADGTLRFRAGNPAIHLFAVDFLARVTSTGGLPYHVANKAVVHHDPESNTTIDPGKNANALKFERFIFDALPLAERWLAVEARRSEEFAPVKNAMGADSPETARAAQIALHASWLEQAGIEAEEHPVEVSPLFALDAEELADKLRTGLKISGPTYLS